MANASDSGDDKSTVINSKGLTTIARGLRADPDGAAEGNVSVAVVVVETGCYRR